MSTSTYNRKKRQLNNLASKVNQLILNGEWIKLSSSARNRLIFKLNLLCKQLQSYLSYGELRKILAAAAIFIGFPVVSQAQSFAPPLTNPFWLTTDSISLASPKFADIDNDGDYDLFEGKYGGFIQFFENTGTVQTPVFATPLQNPFGIVTPIDDYNIAFPAFADIDNDGDQDLFIGGIYSVEPEHADIKFYENTGTDVSPAFAAPQANPFSLEPAYLFAMPVFADIDNDGDFDLFVGEGYGAFKFFENTGTVSEPEFAVPVQNPFGLTPVNSFGSPAFADTDHDGDLDLYVGEYYGNTRYFENTGTATSPVFAAPVTNPFGLVQTNYYNFPAFADLDNDGDEDIMIGEYYSFLKYFRNTEINIGIGENQGEEFFSLYPNPATDFVIISLNKNFGEMTKQVSIIDLNGRVIKTAEITTNDLRLTTDDLQPGLYFVRLVQGEKVFSRKMVVNK